jgi:hypothetical protein
MADLENDANNSESPLPYEDFDGLCKLLHSNDPNCTRAEVIWDDDRNYDLCPIGYGPQLGEALRNNTVVNCIELQLGLLEQRGLNTESGQRTYVANSGDEVLHFLRHSTTLRTVKLRTGAMAGDHGMINYVDDEVTELVELAVMAVAENPHGPLVLHLDNTYLGDETSYPVNVPTDTLVNALRVSKTMQELVIWLGDGRTEPYEEPDDVEAQDEDAEEPEVIRAKIANAFGDNTSLQRLIIWWASDARTVQSLVETGLRRNGSIVSVKLCDGNAAQKRLAKRYCDRNQGVLNFLSKLQQHTKAASGGNNDAGDVVAAAAAANDDANKDDDARQRRLQVLPPMFTVIQHSPRMAFSRVLQGLNALSEKELEGHVGSQTGDRKRASAADAAAEDKRDGGQ